MEQRWAAPQSDRAEDRQAGGEQEMTGGAAAATSGENAQAQARAIEADQARLQDQNQGQDQFSATERYDAALQLYLAANVQRVERIESRLETLVENQRAEVSERQAHPPGFWAGRQAKAEWSAGVEHAQERLQTLVRRQDRVQELETRTEELAEDKLRRDEPELTRERDAQRLQERREQQAQWRERSREREQSRTGQGHDLALER